MHSTLLGSGSGVKETKTHAGNRAICSSKRHKNSPCPVCFLFRDLEIEESLDIPCEFDILMIEPYIFDLSGE